MSKYDQFLAGLPQESTATAKTSGKYDQFTSDLEKPKIDVRDVASKALFSHISGMQPHVKIKKGLVKGAEYLAEKLGESGANPYASAAATLPIAIFPELLAAGTSLGALYGPSTTAKAIRNTPKMLSKQYDDALEGVISGDMPVRRGAFARVPKAIEGNPPKDFFEITTYKPESYPRDTPSLFNFARARIKGLGDKLSTQELDDYYKMFKAELSDMNAKGLGNTERFAEISKLQKDISGLRSKSIPGMEDLNKVYAKSKALREIPGKIYSGGKKIAKAGAVAGGLGYLYNLLK